MIERDAHTFFAPNEIDDWIELSSEDAEDRTYFLQQIASELKTLRCEECRQRLIRARNTVVDAWDRQRGGTA
jgi:hypothetical protein